MAGPRARFCEIYDRYAHLILAYAARRTTGPDDAADVLAEVFTVAWRRIADVPDGDDARLWLYGVARRVVANTRRGDHRRRRLDERLQHEVAAVVTSAQRTVADRAGGAVDDTTRVAVAFNRLRPTDREILTLVGWEGLDRDEVARVLGSSRARVRVRLHRARTRLLRLLDEQDANPPAASDQRQHLPTGTHSKEAP